MNGEYEGDRRGVVMRGGAGPAGGRGMSHRQHKTGSMFMLKDICRVSERRLYPVC